MVAKILSGATIGLDGILVKVEVDVAKKGFPAFNIVGLPSKSIDEAKERVRTAIVNSGYEIPDSRITVNLAPADFPKEGSSFDLPIAVGILAASGMINKETIGQSLFIGELSLEGEIRPVRGAVSIALLARKEKIDRLFLPFSCAYEASLVDEIIIYPVKTLEDLVLHLNGHIKLAVFNDDTGFLLQKKKYSYLFEDVKGQETAKRALEIAAAGFHNIFLSGPPGTGKTYLSRALPSIIPPMDREEILEVTKIHSIAGILNREIFVLDRPFRSPHHTTSKIGLIGGGSHPMPGEISLAHRGVLFLDELPEFPRHIIESLRQPLEDGRITISRAQGSLEFPSRFILLAAANGCPCGYLGHPKKACHCLPGAILKYRKKLSGPLIDRIDIHVSVPPVEEKDLVSFSGGESSLTVQKRVVAARERQKIRFANSGIFNNGEMRSPDIRKFCRLDDQALALLKSAIDKLTLSARSYFKTIKIAQTIADLAATDQINVSHIAEALQYRAKSS